MNLVDTQPEFNDNGTIRNEDTYYECVLAKAIKESPYVKERLIPESRLAASLPDAVFCNYYDRSHARADDMRVLAYNVDYPIDFDDTRDEFQAKLEAYEKEDSPLSNEAVQTGVALGIAIDGMQNHYRALDFSDNPGEINSLYGHTTLPVTDEVDRTAALSYQISPCYEKADSSVTGCSNQIREREKIQQALNIYAEKGSELEAMGKENPVVATADDIRLKKSVEEVQREQDASFSAKTEWLNRSYAEKLDILAEKISNGDTLKFDYPPTQISGAIDSATQTLKNYLKADHSFGLRFDVQKNRMNYDSTEERINVENAVSTLNNISIALTNKPFAVTGIGYDFDFDMNVDICLGQLEEDMKDKTKNLSVKQRLDENRQSRGFKTELNGEEETVVLNAARYARGNGLELSMASPDGKKLGELTTDLAKAAPVGCVYIDPNDSQEKVRLMEDNGLGKRIGTARCTGQEYSIIQYNKERLKETLVFGKEYVDDEPEGCRVNNLTLTTPEHKGQIRITENKNGSKTGSVLLPLADGTAARFTIKDPDTQILDYGKKTSTGYPKVDVVFPDGTVGIHMKNNEKTGKLERTGDTVCIEDVIRARAGRTATRENEGVYTAEDTVENEIQQSGDFGE